MEQGLVYQEARLKALEETVAYLRDAHDRQALRVGELEAALAENCEREAELCRALLFVAANSSNTNDMYSSHWVMRQLSKRLGVKIHYSTTTRSDDEEEEKDK